MATLDEIASRYGLNKTKPKLNDVAVRYGLLSPDEAVTKSQSGDGQIAGSFASNAASNLQDRVLGTGAAGLDLIANTAAQANTQTPWDDVPGGSTAFNLLEAGAGAITGARDYLPDFLTERAQALQTGLANDRANTGTVGPRSEFLQDFEGQAREYAADARASQSEEEQAAQQGLGAATEAGAVDTLSFLWDNPRALGSVVDSLIPSIAAGGAGGRVVGGLSGARNAAIAAQLGVGATVEGAAAGQGAYDAVMAADEMELATSDAYWALREQLGSDEAAREAMADIARTVGSTTGAGSSLLLAGISQKLGANVVEDRLLGRVMAGTTGSRTANTALGFTREALSEGAEGAAAQLSQNIGAAASNAEDNLLSGVGSAAVLESLAGGASGAVVGATGRTSRPPALPDTGDTAFDAGKNTAAALAPEATVSETTETVPQAPVPKPRFRMVDGQLQRVDTPIEPPAPVVPPVVEALDGEATEADLQSIDQQLSAEQSRIQNSEARNRVISELSNARDRKTAQAVEQLIAQGRIQFYGDQGTLPEGADSVTDKGYFDGQNIFLNEANLAEGEATAVALHEIKHFMDKQAEQGGAVINRRSLRQFIGNESNTRLNSRIQELANTKNKIAQEAIEDARFGATDADGNFNQEVFNDEVVPYFLQRVAVARDSKRPLGRVTSVVRDIVSAAKARIADFGIDLNLSENDILYLGRQLVGEAARSAAQSGQASGTQQSKGRAALVGPKAANFQQYLDQGIVFEGALDNLPRAEIDDSTTVIRPSGRELLERKGSTPLGVLLEHPELYDNYPGIKRTRIRLFTPEEVASSPTLLGQANAAENTISINPSMLNNEQELRRLLLHEGQHIIQSKEGFVPGASPSEYMSEGDSASFTKADNEIRTFLNTVDRNTINAISSKLSMPDRDKPVSAQRIITAAYRQDPSLQSFEPEERAMMNEYRRLSDAYVPLEKKRQEAYDRYQKTGGEVESRGVEARMDYSPEDRRDIPFYTTTSTMRGGVPVDQMIDNTRPESGSRFASKRAQRRTEATEGRASKTRPAQPKQVNRRVGAAGVTQPTVARRAPVPTQARGVVPAARSERFVGEKTVSPTDRNIGQDILNVGKTVVSALAPSTRGTAADVREILERSGGEMTVSKVRASQSLNALNQAVNRIPKPQRATVQRLLVAASSEDAATRGAAINTLKNNHPAVYANFDSVRNSIRQMSLDAIVSIRDSGKQLTKKDVAIVNKMFQSLDSYVTRTYRIDQKGRVAQQQQKETYGAWTKGDRTSEGAKAFEDARQYVMNTLRIGAFQGTKEGLPKGYQPQSLEQLEALHQEWVSRDIATTLPADATEEQRDTYISRLIKDLAEVRASMSDASYEKQLENKATRLTKELVDVVNAGSSKLVQFFRGARQDNTIVSARADVPEPIRRVWGEITDPAAGLALTMMRQGEFLARQKMLRELYDIGLGRYFVDQKDAGADVFTERLTGETFGPLEGMYATPRFKESIESTIEPLNSFRKVIEAMTQGKADIAAQGAAALSVGALGKAAALNKKATVIWNPAAWVNNFLGGPSTPIMQGFAPGQGMGRAIKAAKQIIGPTFSTKALGPEAEAVLKANLQESGQVGEIQSSTRGIIEDTLLNEHSNLFVQKARQGVSRTKDSITDAYAMTDVVWKLSAFFATTDWLKGYYKAKGITRTQEQIEREAAQRVKERSITFANAAPLVKFTEKLGATSYAAYFYETYRVTVNSIIGATRDIIEGVQEGGTAGRMKTALGILSAAGATANLAYNRAILPIYEAVGAGVVLPSLIALGALEAPDEEEKEKLDVIRKGMSDFYVGKELSLWRITDDGKYIFIEPGRVNPNDPATGPMAAFASGEPEEALKMITGLLFANQGVMNVLSVGAETIAGDKAKKPKAAYRTPESYAEMENILQEAGVSPTATARVTRVLENYIPRVAQTVLRESREDTGLTGPDKFLAAMGQPFAIFDPKKDLEMTGYRDYKDPVEQARTDFKTAIQTLNPSDNTIRDAYINSVRGEHKAYTRMREVVEAAKAAGLSNGEISRILKGDVKLNRSQIGSLVTGSTGAFRPTFVSRDVLATSRKDEIKAANGNTEKIKAINDKYTRINRVLQTTQSELKTLLEEIE